MTNESNTPVTILTGFLGAGKTTLLERILKDPQGRRFGVLVNDFGAINIDAELVVEASGEQVSLANGCICCSIRDDLVTAVEGLLTGDPRPDHLVIEASGLSRPIAVAEALEAPTLRDRVALDGIFCLIDAATFGELDFASTELALDQAFGSDILLLNKCDVAEPAAVGAVESSLREALPRIRILRTTYSEVPQSLLFGPQERGLRPTASEPGAQQPSTDDHKHDHDHGHDHPHDEAYMSWSWRAPAPLDRPAFRAAARELPTTLLRAKGILAFSDRPEARSVFQVVGKRRSLQEKAGSPPEECMLVAIARRGELNPERLTALFDACRLPSTP